MAFLAWLRTFCFCTLTAQIKADNFAIVPATSDVFRAAVSSLLSLDGKNGVRFHNYSLPEDRGVRLLTKNFSNRIPEDVVLKELGSLDIRV
jgi:hypothetical protein